MLTAQRRLQIDRASAPLDPLRLAQGT
jgi:hypothetical protein